MNPHLFPPSSPHAPRLADLLIRAAAIYSIAQHRTVYQAIVIRDEWIVAVSPDPHGLDGLISPDTHVLDARMSSRWLGAGQSMIQRPCSASRAKARQDVTKTSLIVLYYIF